MHAPPAIRDWVRDLPIERKLLLCVFSTCLTALVLACAALFWFQTSNFRKGFASELESLGTVIAHNSAAPLAFDDRRSAIEVLKALEQNPFVVSAGIHDAAGKLFASVGAQKLFEPSQAAGVVFHDGYATFGATIRGDAGATGRLTIRARYGDRYRELVALYGAVLLVVTVGSLLVILVMSSFLQRMISRPIMELAATAERVSKREDYGARAREFGRDEVGLLTRTFNRMLEQIQARDTKLKESQERYEVAVKGSSDGLWDWNLIENSVHFSPRWKSMLGYGADELTNELETFRRLVHPEDCDRVFAAVDSHLSGRSPSYGTEFRMQRKDGSWCWILSRGAAVRDESGRALRLAGSHADITERKRSEDQIRQATEKFETLVNSVNGIVWEADPISGQCLFVSEQASRLLGFPTSRWLAEPGFWLKIIHPADRAATYRAVRRAISSGDPFHIEHRNLAADGSVVWLRDSVAVERQTTGPTILRGLSIDVTEQKLAAEHIAKMQRELLEASRLAGMAEVATGVLHNVGNVLNSVNLSAGLVVEQLRKSKTASLARAAQLLREREGDMAAFLTGDAKGRQLPAFFVAVADELTREQELLAREAQALQQNIDHIKRIVAMQQSFAKVSGATELMVVSEVVEDALRIAASGMARHRVEVVRQFEPVPLIQMDRHKVLQILVNLLNNAKQALEVRMDERRITVRVASIAGGRVCVEVSDNGMGIPSENLAKIFNHGFTTKKTGHGFGLHSGANAAKEMGGSLNVRSEGLGHGATFSLELPVSQPAALTAERRAA